MNLRKKLVDIALEWQEKYGVAPSITSSISEYDAAMLVGCSDQEYSEYMQDKTAVSRGYDFIFEDKRYQVKANRPSGKPGSKITMTSRATNYDWDYLIWVLYDKNYNLLEAWQWDRERYIEHFELKKRLTPDDMRKGKKIN